MHDNNQSRLAHVTRTLIRPEFLPSLRGAAVQWIGTTIHISYFFDQEITEDEHEEAADVATEIVAQFSGAYLSEKFISLSANEPLPNHPFLVYKRDT